MSRGLIRMAVDAAPVLVVGLMTATSAKADMCVLPLRPGRRESSRGHEPFHDGSVVGVA